MRDYYKVRGDAMYPTIPNGSRLIVLRQRYPAADVQRGNIVIYTAAEDPTKDIVGRVIALGGDVLEIKAKHVHVNGEQLEEPYVRLSDVEAERLGAGRPATRIPDGHAFVMGDNRGNAKDSRRDGPVPLTSIRGRVVYVNKGTRESDSP